MALVTWPFAVSGDLLWRDMSVPSHVGLIPENFGGGDLPARNVPQDGALALFSIFGPAHWLVRFLVFSSAACAALAGWSLAKRAPAPAMLIAVVNPFVVERLLQGQWSLVLAAWMLPAIAAAGVKGHPTLAWLSMFVASLSPTGGIFGLITGVATVSGRRLHTALLGTFFCLPWLIPGLLSPARPTNTAAAVAAFAPRAENGAGTVGSLLSLGGIWNAEALPPSRRAGFALCGVVVFACILLGARHLTNRQWAPLWLLALAGLGLAVGSWFYPHALEYLIDQVPGTGLFRDSQKLVMLAIPWCVVAAGALTGTWRLIAVAAMFLQMPDFSSSLAVLAPSPVAGPQTQAAAINPRLVGEIGNKTAFFPQRSGLITIPGAVAVDPYTKAVSMVTSGQLSVDGQIVDPPSPRYLAANAAWQSQDLAALERLGIGAVVVDGKVVASTPATRPALPWILTTAWALSPLLILGLAALRRAR